MLMTVLFITITLTDITHISNAHNPMLIMCTYICYILTIKEIDRASGAIIARDESDYSATYLNLNLTLTFILRCKL